MLFRLTLSDSGETQTASVWEIYQHQDNRNSLCLHGMMEDINPYCRFEQSAVESTKGKYADIVAWREVIGAKKTNDNQEKR